MQKNTIADKDDKPGCACFTEGGVGEEWAMFTAVEIATSFGEMVDTFGLCPASHEYTLLSSMVLIMRGICAQRVGGNIHHERAEFIRMCVGMSDKLRVREQGMELAAAVVEAQAVRVKS